MVQMKTKVRKTYNFLIRLLIIIVTYGFIYNQVFYKRDFSSVFSTFGGIFNNSWFVCAIIIVFLLMILNWGTEAFKWNYLINRIEKISYLKALKAVLTGVAVSTFTPNRVGDYFGRVFILDHGSRIEGVLVTILGSMSQLLVTFIMGTSAIFFMFLGYHETLLDYFNISRHLYIYFMLGGAVLILALNILVALLFLNVSLLSSLALKLKGKWVEKLYRYIMVISSYSSKELLYVILLSFLRFVVFSFQLYLLLRLFSVDLPFFQGMIIIAVIFFVMTIIPTVAITELGIRGSVSLFLIGMYFGGPEMTPESVNLGIVAASTALWIINLALPALIGAVFVFSLKFFRKINHE
jgi:uncharacterized membrane protein YbhN (UPF0104 family)